MLDVALPGPIQRPRERRYGAEVQNALRISWQAANYIGSKRLAPFLQELVPALERHGYLGLSEEVRNQLLSIYDPAKTPFQRLRVALGAEATESLSTIYLALDPVELLRQIKIMQDALWKHAVLRTGSPAPEVNDTVQLTEIWLKPTKLSRSAGKKQKDISDIVPANLDQQKRKYRRTKADRVPHTWRTREDPFQLVWDEFCSQLEASPERTNVRQSPSFWSCRIAIQASTLTVNCAPCKGVSKIGDPRPFSVSMIDGLRQTGSLKMGCQAPSRQ